MSANYLKATKGINHEVFIKALVALCTSKC